MPIYTVRCQKCRKKLDVVRSLKDWGRWPIHCEVKMVQVVQPPQIMHDIEPMRPPVVDVDTGKRADIRSRSGLKDFERRNKCHQVGDDLKAVPKKWVPMPPLKEDLKRARDTVLARRKSHG